MSYLPALFAVWFVHLLAAASPGPAFVATVRVTAQSERRVALAHALGLGLGAVCWAAAAILGLHALMLKVAWLYRVLQFAGGAYLIYIGIQAWLHARDELHIGRATGPAMTGWMAFRRGCATNLSNPKAMVFFGSIFSSLLNPAWPQWVYFAALAVVTVNEAGWFTILTLLLTTDHARAGFRQAKRHIERAAGTLMLVFGGKLAWTSLR